MFDGKTFLPVTGTPMRKMACMMRPFAEAEPVPLAVAILKAKSLVLSMDLVAINSQLPTANSQGTQSPPAAHLGNVGVGNWKLGVDVSHGQQRNHLALARVGNLEDELAHVPRVGGTPLRAQAAVQADVLVLEH